MLILTCISASVKCDSAENCSLSPLNDSQNDYDGCFRCYITCASKSDRDCLDDFNETVKYDDNGCIRSLLMWNCATYDRDANAIQMGRCLFSSYSTEPMRYTINFITLPKNLSKWSFKFCDKYHRQGPLCGNCQSGRYPLALTYHQSCGECNNELINVIKYVLIAFVPLTLFYFLLVYFQVNILSSSLQGYTLFCQIFSLPIFARILLIGLSGRPASYQYVPFLGQVCSIWNMDFFRWYFLGVCLKANPLTIFSLDLILALYPLLLIIITSSLFRLYDSNYQIIVACWKPFKVFSMKFHKNLDIRTSTINSFTTFLLLSIIKCLSVCSDILTPVRLTTFNLNTNNTTSEWILFNDPSTKYFHATHLPYALLALTVLTVYILMPTMLLLFYPIRSFQRALHKLPSRWQIFINTFVDTFQGFYKDGTNGSSNDYRFFSAYPFVFRIIIVITASVSIRPSFMVFFTLVLVLNILLFLLLEPFKDPSLNTNIIFFLLLLALVVVSIMGYDFAFSYDVKETSIFLYFGILLGLFLLSYNVAMAYWLFKRR